MEKTKTFLRDIFEGFYYTKKKWNPNGTNISITDIGFVAIFFLYYTSLLLLIFGIRVKLYGPLKLTQLDSTLYLFGIYGVIYRLVIYPMIDTSEVNENVDDILIEKKIRKYKLVQAGGFTCCILSFIIVYFLYKK